jgi:hypothetical protein
MPITVPGNIDGQATTLVRSAVTAVDNATINDTNYPAATATDCAGWNTVLLAPRFTGGTTPSVTVQVLFRLGSATDVNAFWGVSETTYTVNQSEIAIVPTYGRRVFFRVSALSGAPTNVSLYCAGAEAFKYAGPPRG